MQRTGLTNYFSFLVLPGLERGVTYRVSLKKGTFVIFCLISVLDLLFHMCFGIIISSPFHLAIQKVSIQNLYCPKNACADMIFITALRSED